MILLVRLAGNLTGKSIFTFRVILSLAAAVFWRAAKPKDLRFAPEAAVPTGLGSMLGATQHSAFGSMLG